MPAGSNPHSNGDLFSLSPPALYAKTAAPRKRPVRPRQKVPYPKFNQMCGSRITQEREEGELRVAAKDLKSYVRDILPTLSLNGGLVDLSRILAR